MEKISLNLPIFMLQKRRDFIKMLAYEDKSDALKTIIKNVRKKLPKDTIKNIFGIGYNIRKDSVVILFRCILLFTIFTGSLFAHQLKENYLLVDYNTTTKKLHLVFEIETRLFETTAIDDSKNGIVSFKELQNHEKILTNYITKHIQLQYKHKPLDFLHGKKKFQRKQVQTYFQIDTTYNNIDINQLSIHYSMFFEKESTHKMLINIPSTRTQVILDTRSHSYTFSTAFMTNWQRFYTFVVEGIFHILEGTDHILFLTMLILPVVITRERLSSLIIVATAFSVAHSLTLFVSGMHWYVPNSALIESGIALSIMVVALLNFLGRYKNVNYKIAFAFGLLHGFGFANVLEIAGVKSLSSFIVALFGFNIGVEIGQLFIILTTFPLLLLIYKYSFSKYLTKFITSITFIIATIWFIERIQ